MRNTISTSVLFIAALSGVAAPVGVLVGANPNPRASVLAEADTPIRPALQVVEADAPTRPALQVVEADTPIRPAAQVVEADTPIRPASQRIAA